MAFLWYELKLELDKNKLTHLGREYAKFLAHYIRWPLLGKPSRSGTVNTILLPKKNHWRSPKSEFCHDLKVNFAPTILIPLNDLNSKLIEKGFAEDFPSGRPKYVGKYLHLSDYDIVKKYNSFLTKIMVFYNMAYNRSGLAELLYILEYSLAHTLAAKHRSTLAKTFRKYGKPIVVNAGDLGRIKFAKPSSLKAVHLNNSYKKFNVEIERWKIEYRTKDPISMFD